MLIGCSCHRQKGGALSHNVPDTLQSVFEFQISGNDAQKNVQLSRLNVSQTVRLITQTGINSCRKNRPITLSKATHIINFITEDAAVMSHRFHSYI